MIYAVYKVRKGMRVRNEQTILNYIKVITQASIVIYIKHKRNYNTYNADFFFYTKICLVVLSLSRKSAKIYCYISPKYFQFYSITLHFW